LFEKSSQKFPTGGSKMESKVAKMLLAAQKDGAF
jgi:hypothetical protein